jgi:putative protease
LSDQKDEISKLNPKALRIHFTIEDEKITKQRMQLLEHVFSQDGEGEEPHFEFTRGHFKRGIK